MNDENGVTSQEENTYENAKVELSYSKIQPVWHFIILSVFSFGWYQLYWIYKNWHFIKDRLNIKISPAKRTFFSLFFLYSLFKKIFVMAREKGYSKKYPIALFYIAAIFLAYASFLPMPYNLLSYLDLLVYIPFVKMLNYIYKQEEPDAKVRTFLSRGQKIFLLVSFLIFITYIMYKK